MNDVLIDETADASPQPTPETAKPDNLPEKFWDEKAQTVRLDALISSYLALEKKLSTALPAPDTMENKARVQKALGVPDSADQYIIDVSHGLFESDPDVNARLHALGFTPAQAQAVYDLAAQKLVPLIIELSDSFKADREVERLVAAFGGPEKWQEVSRQLLNFGKKNLPPDVLKSLSCSFEGVMALYRMMKSGEAPAMAGASATAEPVTEQDLQGMMRDPRYWKQKDPAYVGKVTAGFKKIYGGK